MRSQLGAALTAGIALFAAAPASATGPTVLRVDGIGQLHLGMSQTAALQTGWLAGRSTGCELSGPPLPVTYRFTGPKAPRGLVGTAEFHANRLRVLSFTRGVRTSTGVTVGRTTTSRMVGRYRQAGFTASARFVDTFQGTFVTIKRHGQDVVGGFAKHRVLGMIAIPAIPVCE